MEEITKENVERLYKQLKSWTKVADKLGISTDTLNRRRKQWAEEAKIAKDLKPLKETLFNLSCQLLKIAGEAQRVAKIAAVDKVMFERENELAKEENACCYKLMEIPQPEPMVKLAIELNQDDIDLLKKFSGVCLAEFNKNELPIPSIIQKLIEIVQLMIEKDMIPQSYLEHFGSALNEFEKWLN